MLAILSNVVTTEQGWLMLMNYNTLNYSSNYFIAEQLSSKINKVVTVVKSWAFDEMVHLQECLPEMKKSEWIIFPCFLDVEDPIIVCMHVDL